MECQKTGYKENKNLKKIEKNQDQDQEDIEIRISEDDIPREKKNKENEPLLTQNIEKKNSNNRISFASIKRVMQVGGRILFNIVLCNYLKYLCLSGFADRSTMNGLTSSDFFLRNGFVLLKVVYNLGTFFGKSSLFCFKIKTLEITTFPLVFFMFAFGYFAYEGDSNIFLQMFLMLLVGWIAGIN